MESQEKYTQLMVNRIKILIFALFVSTNVFTTNAESFSVRFKKVIEQDDANKKRYETNVLLDNFVNELRSEKVIIDSTLSPLEVLIASDSTFTIFTLTSQFNDGSAQFDWIVYYNYHQLQGNKALRFTKKLNSADYRSAMPLKIVTTLQPYIVGYGTYQKIQFTDSLSNKNIVTVDDVLLQCSFYELAEKQSEDSLNDANKKIVRRLTPLISSIEYFDNSFAGFDKLGTIFSSDKKVKILTWNAITESGVNRYFGKIIRKDSKGKLYVTHLKETEVKMEGAANQNFTDKRWFGNNYYQIIDGKDSNKKPYYLLLGSRTNSEFSKCKVVEVLWFTSNGEVRFGNQLFDVGKISPKRLVYEYAFNTSMMLRYDEPSKMIVMDHLSPRNPEYKDDKRFYVPDFSYDGLKLVDGKWTLVPDIDLRNPAHKQVTRKPQSNKM